eukprot:6181003-Pleurochrysis_carterae.AAC.1
MSYLKTRRDSYQVSPQSGVVSRPNMACKAVPDETILLKPCGKRRVERIRRECLDPKSQLQRTKSIGHEAATPRGSADRGDGDAANAQMAVSRVDIESAEPCAEEMRVEAE